MSTAIKLLAAELEKTLKAKDEAIRCRGIHAQKVEDYDTIAMIHAEEEATLTRDLEAVRRASGPQAAPDERCNKPLLDGRNEIRCWGKLDHEGECT